MDTTVTSPLIIYHATLRSSARKHPLRCSEKQAWPCSWPHAADAERWGCNERWQPSKQMLLEQLYVAYIQELMGGAGVDLEAAVSCTNEWMLSTMESHVLPGSWSETMRRRSSRTVTLFPKPPFFFALLWTLHTKSKQNPSIYYSSCVMPQTIFSKIKSLRNRHHAIC